MSSGVQSCSSDYQKFWGPSVSWNKEKLTVVVVAMAVVLLNIIILSYGLLLLFCC